MYGLTSDGLTTNYSLLALKVLPFTRFEVKHNGRMRSPSRLCKIVGPGPHSTGGFLLFSIFDDLVIISGFTFKPNLNDGDEWC